MHNECMQPGAVAVVPTFSVALLRVLLALVFFSLIKRTVRLVVAFWRELVMSHEWERVDPAKKC